PDLLEPQRAHGLEPGECVEVVERAAEVEAADDLCQRRKAAEVRQSRVVLEDQAAQHGDALEDADVRQLVVVDEVEMEPFVDDRRGQASERREVRVAPDAELGRLDAELRERLEAAHIRDREPGQENPTNALEAAQTLEIDERRATNDEPAVD